MTDGFYARRVLSEHNRVLRLLAWPCSRVWLRGPCLLAIACVTTVRKNDGGTGDTYWGDGVIDLA